MNVAIIGAGWAGIAAAVAARLDRHQVSVFEATRTLGGRARALAAQLPDGTAVTLDNGQHILIGAYTETLRLMRQVGVPVETALLRLPLTLTFPDGAGLSLPALPAPLDALIGILSTRGWRWRDKLSLLRTAAQWQHSGFVCPATLTVAELCARLSPRVVQELIEPLCVSALNTPTRSASAQVFLRVLKDSLMGAPGGSNLLLPRLDLSVLFPLAGAAWLRQRGADVRLGTRVTHLSHSGAQWQLDGETFDAVILAVPPTEATRLTQQVANGLPAALAKDLTHWAQTAQALSFEAITTVYTWGADARLNAPLLALRSNPEHPAQFVFDRAQLGGPSGLLAWVISASRGEREALQSQVLAQAQAQFGWTLQALKTVVEKRATFACTAQLQRPASLIAPGLLACGDYVAGPYPATLEGAVRSAIEAVALL